MFSIEFHLVKKNVQIKEGQQGWGVGRAGTDGGALKRFSPRLPLPVPHPIPPDQGSDGPHMHCDTICKENELYIHEMGCILCVYTEVNIKTKD